MDAAPDALRIDPSRLDASRIAVESEPGRPPEWAVEADPSFPSAADSVPAAAFSNVREEKKAPAEKPEQAPANHPSHEVLSSWRWLSAAWYKAPRDLKILLVVLPVLVGLAVGPSVPKVKVSVSSATANNVQQVVVTQWKDLQQTISNRAAVAFADDFRSGLDAWQSRSNLTEAGLMTCPASFAPAR